MYKILLVVLLAAAVFGLYAMQMDEEAAVQVFFQLKRSVNRAAHAAAQQVDMQQLAHGSVQFDKSQAMSAARQYLRHNLGLDEQLAAADESFLTGQVEIRVLELIDDQETFPYRYANEQYDYEVTLDRPGVILIIEAEYDRLFAALGPLSWHVKGAAEIVR